MSLWVDKVCKLGRFWVYKFVSRSVFELRSFVSWWGYEGVSFLVDKFMRVWVGKFVGWEVSEFFSWCIRELLGFREFIGQWADLPHPSYVSGVFILSWHHKDKKLLSIYRKIKSRDGFDNKYNIRRNTIKKIILLFLFVFFAEIYNFALLEKEKGHQKDAQYM